MSIISNDNTEFSTISLPIHFTHLKRNRPLFTDVRITNKFYNILFSAGMFTKAQVGKH